MSKIITIDTLRCVFNHLTEEDLDFIEKYSLDEKLLNFVGKLGYIAIPVPPNGLSVFDMIDMFPEYFSDFIVVEHNFQKTSRDLKELLDSKTKSRILEKFLENLGTTNEYKVEEDGSISEDYKEFLRKQGKIIDTDPSLDQYEKILGNWQNKNNAYSTIRIDENWIFVSEKCSEVDFAFKTLKKERGYFKKENLNLAEMIYFVVFFKKAFDEFIICQEFKFKTSSKLSFWQKDRPHGNMSGPIDYIEHMAYVILNDKNKIDIIWY